MSHLSISHKPGQRMKKTYSTENTVHSVDLSLPALLPTSSSVDKLSPPAGGIVCERHTCKLGDKGKCYIKIRTSVYIKVKREIIKKNSTHPDTGNLVFQKHP